MTSFGRSADGATPVEADRPSVHRAASSPALGAFVATHNERRINVHTAPLPLLEAALRVSGRGGLDLIVEARAAGRQAVLPALPAARRETRRDAGRLEFTGTSDAWAFRVEARVGMATRTWWCVYRRSGRSWECVQRLAIPA